MSTVYSLEHSTGVRSIGFTLGLLAAACLLCIAPATLFAEDVAEEDSAALCDESARDTVKAELSDEQLAEKMEMARAELLQLRSRRHQARQALEANNETARAIIQEMNELRRQLREKNAELEALLVEDERFAEWAKTETSLAEMIRSSTIELQRREQDR